MWKIFILIFITFFLFPGQQTFQKRIKKDTVGINALFKISLKYEKKGKPAGAIPAPDKLIRQYPDSDIYKKSIFRRKK